MAQLNTFNPVGAFQGARQNALTIQGQEQGIAREAAAAPIRNQLAELQLSKAQAGATRSNTEFDQGQALQRATILNQTAKALKGLDPSQWPQAFARLEPKLEEFGIPAGTFNINEATPEALDSIIAETQGFITNPSTLSTGQRERSDLIAAIQPALDENGNFNPELADANAKAAAIELGLISGEGRTTFNERLIEDPSAADKFVQLETDVAGGREKGKLDEQAKLLQGIRAAIKQAEKEAVARGETITDLISAKAAMPGLIKVVDRLKILSDEATFTLFGKGFNEVAKQFGFSAKGGTARDTMISIVTVEIRF